MVVSKAAQKRLDALRAISDEFLREEAEYVVVNTQENRARYAALVRQAATLGRTERWKGTCEGAALTALDTNNDLGWVVRQYGVYMGYAAI